MIAAWVVAATLLGSSDVCSLIPDGDVQSTIGERVVARTPATVPSAGLSMNQCQLVTSGTHGISLAVAAPARDYWKQHFHTGRKRPARKIDGVGDEAYWTVGAMVGALYALMGDRFIRVSVGGYKTERERIETSERLARLVLRRLAVER